METEAFLVEEESFQEIRKCIFTISARRTITHNQNKEMDQRVGGVPPHCGLKWNQIPNNLAKVKGHQRGIRFIHLANIVLWSFELNAKVMCANFVSKVEYKLMLIRSIAIGKTIMVSQFLIPLD